MLQAREPIPAEVATAISAVMAGVKTLGKDGTNSHQRYNFVSTDAFLAAVNPLCASAGLIIIQDEDAISIATVETTDNYGKVKSSSWLTAKYSFILAHKSGATWGPVYRSVMVQANGAQAFGSAQSYALKQFLRSLFQISTGDQDDADQQSADPLPPKQIERKQPTAQSSPAERKAKETAAATFKSAIEMSEDMGELDEWWDKHWPQINALPDDLKTGTFTSTINVPKSLGELGVWWSKNLSLINALPEAMKAEIIKAKDARKAELSKPVLQAAE